MPKIFRHLKTTVLIILSLVYLLVSPSIVYARTAAEIQKEIDAKKLEIQALSTNISTLEKQILEGKSKLEQTSSKREQLAVQISNIAKEKELIEVRLKDIEEQKQLKELEKEGRIKAQDEFITNAYLNWKETNWIKEFIGSESEDLVKVATYQATVAGEEQNNIEKLGIEIISLKTELESLETKETDLKNQLSNLSLQVERIEQELASLDLKIQKNNSDAGNYRAKIGNVQSQIDQLTKEQKEIQEAERKLLLKSNANNSNKNSPSGTKQVIKGEIYFQGIGREVYQGHGVGFSQFGAVGAALEGWDYEKIIKFYYPGAKLSKVNPSASRGDSMEPSSGQVKVDGYGSMSIEDYVAGAGEVPDFSCEDIDEKFDPDNVWKCWPEETIKAQMVIFRTYGIYRSKDGSSICTSAACQVYKGGANKRWAAEATEYEIITYDDKPINAVYSSDNHNGWGTADNDTVWSNFEGTGTPVEYLRAVNDSAFTYKFVYTDWSWRTNSYTIEEIAKVLEWSSISKEASASYKDFVKQTVAKTGKLQNLEFERDKSGRVKKVKLTGDKGSAYMAGWLFKSIWNIYVGNEKPSGETDYIYSLTYFMKQG
jgi:SpoIID/LytB domain protein